MPGAGEDNHYAKLTAMQVWEIRDIYQANTDGGRVRQGQTQRWLAKKFKLALGTVRKIVWWHTWKNPVFGKTWEQWEKENGVRSRVSVPSKGAKVDRRGHR